LEGFQGCASRHQVNRSSQANRELCGLGKEVFVDAKLVETILHWVLGAMLGSTALFCTTWLAVTLIRRRDQTHEVNELRERLLRLEEATDHMVGRLVEMDERGGLLAPRRTPVPEMRSTHPSQTPH
jgi:hypothetical protein